VSEEADAKFNALCAKLERIESAFAELKGAFRAHDTDERKFWAGMECRFELLIQAMERLGDEEGV
jgi:hypothetical protein